MTNNVYIKTWGDFACFTSFSRNERVSYPVITPSAARGILECILYKPQFRWQINRIAVKNQIKFIPFKTNEVKKVFTSNEMKYIDITDGEVKTQCCNLILKNVHYVIEASVLIKNPSEDNTVIKYVSMFNRRVSNGQFFRSPYFGMRQFVAKFESASKDDMIVNPNPNENKNFGRILFDRFDLDKNEVGSQKITTFEAKLTNGIMDVPTWENVKENHNKLFK